MEVSLIAPQELARMRDKSMPVVDKYSKTVGEALVKEVYAELDSVRKKAAGSSASSNSR